MLGFAAAIALDREFRGRGLVRGILLIPAGWGAKLAEGDPQPLQLTLDTADINTALELEGSLRVTLGEFQMNERQQVIDDLPEEVFGEIHLHPWHTPNIHPRRSPS